MSIWGTNAGIGTKNQKPFFEHATRTRRRGTPDDFAAIAVYLMSDASRWHTGDIIKIDGGFSIF